MWSWSNPHLIIFHLCQLDNSSLPRLSAHTHTHNWKHTAVYCELVSIKRLGTLICLHLFTDMLVILSLKWRLAHAWYCFKAYMQTRRALIHTYARTHTLPALCDHLRLCTLRWRVHMEWECVCVCVLLSVSTPLVPHSGWNHCIRWVRSSSLDWI